MPQRSEWRYVTLRLLSVKTSTELTATGFTVHSSPAPHVSGQPRQADPPSSTPQVKPSTACTLHTSPAPPPSHPLESLRADTARLRTPAPEPLQPAGSAPAALEAVPCRLSSHGAPCPAASRRPRALPAADTRRRRDVARVSPATRGHRAGTAAESGAAADAEATPLHLVRCLALPRHVPLGPLGTGLICGGSRRRCSPWASGSGGSPAHGPCAGLNSVLPT